MKEVEFVASSGYIEHPIYYGSPNGIFETPEEAYEASKRQYEIEKKAREI